MSVSSVIQSKGCLCSFVERKINKYHRQCLSRLFNWWVYTYDVGRIIFVGHTAPYLYLHFSTKDRTTWHLRNAEIDASGDAP